MAGKRKSPAGRAGAQGETSPSRWLHKRLERMQRESRMRSKPERAAKAGLYADKLALELLPYERGKKAPVDSKGDDIKAARLIVLE